MEKAVRAKFEQNESLAALLLSTEDQVLVEHTTNDRDWGDGDDGTWRPAPGSEDQWGPGKNMLGKILMDVRAELRAKRSRPAPGPSSLPGDLSGELVSALSRIEELELQLAPATAGPDRVQLAMPAPKVLTLAMHDNALECLTDDTTRCSTDGGRRWHPLVKQLNQLK